jgi:hypothetical protein
MRLKRSAEDAQKLVLSIPHETCSNAVDYRWKVNPDGTVRAQSVLWLFCWAKTGMNSEDARQAAVRVFNDILPISFAQFDTAVDHKYARKARYMSGNIEDELEQLLAGPRSVAVA